MAIQVTKTNALANGGSLDAAHCLDDHQALRVAFGSMLDGYDDDDTATAERDFHSIGSFPAELRQQIYQYYFQEDKVSMCRDWYVRVHDRYPIGA
jgi:hypothetical protein